MISLLLKKYVTFIYNAIIRKRNSVKKQRLSSKIKSMPNVDLKYCMLISRHKYGTQS